MSAASQPRRARSSLSHEHIEIGDERLRQIGLRCGARRGTACRPSPARVIARRRARA